MNTPKRKLPYIPPSRTIPQDATSPSRLPTLTLPTEPTAVTTARQIKERAQQTRDKAYWGPKVETAGKVLSSLGAPQRKAMKVLTGSEQTPSQWLAQKGVLNPNAPGRLGMVNRAIGAVDDAVFDPVNLLGVGIAQKISGARKLEAGIQAKKVLEAERLAAFKNSNVVYPTPIRANAIPEGTSLADKLNIMRDGKSILNYTEDPTKIYRTIKEDQLADILTHGKLRTPGEAGIKGKNNFRENLQWYQGHASSRYGHIAIEAPNGPYTPDDLLFHIPGEGGAFTKKTLKQLQAERATTPTYQQGTRGIKPLRKLKYTPFHGR